MSASLALSWWMLPSLAVGMASLAISTLCWRERDTELCLPFLLVGAILVCLMLATRFLP